MARVTLTAEKETLLVPLWGKAVEGRRQHPVLVDPKAQEILDGIDYDFEALAIPDKTALMMAMRAARLDQVATAFLGRHPEATVLHLGCGLDARCERVAHPQAAWFDLDHPEVIELRRRFYAETEGYHMLSSSVTELQWLEEVPATEQPALVLAEGLTMYLREEEVRALFAALGQRFAQVELAFDAYSTLTAKRAARHPSLKKTGASIHWGIGAELLEEWAFSDSDHLPKLDWSTRLLFRMAGWFKAGRRAHRILSYALSQ